jgi:cysteinyl-tRNA synthetase
MGIDEHTALVLNSEELKIRITGKGRAFWRSRGNDVILANDSTIQLQHLINCIPQMSQSVRLAEPITPSTPLELAKLVEQGGPSAQEALVKLVTIANSSREGQIDPSPLIDSLLLARADFKKSGNFEFADQIREIIFAVGIKVEDNPEGSTWSITK